ncbi:hypothetical protein DFA_01645 [Cavenderia fasciculata]|uniref:Ankyrin repeat-containing protein n=1 Tax=Cavenderia fasciculata TaxID=261658 RepID=F4PTZ1_CACFS|nr:uncharacterized protein DFA_01645 [Cavenderia fasciculata]EGG21759.1 hypothetical protein DFA_01645 [Cavenderia fasciculata]|eukprot:XP_004359609.1 hypothetical protein DFA_01645 [Cavenderia fasciculata]
MDNDIFFKTIRNIYLFKSIFNQVTQIHKTLGKKSYTIKDVLFAWASKNGYDRLVIEKFRLYPQSLKDQLNKYNYTNAAIADAVLLNKYLVLDDYKKVLGMETNNFIRLLDSLAMNHQWYRDDACKLIEAIEYTKTQLVGKRQYRQDEFLYYYSTKIVTATIQSNNLQAVQYVLEKLVYTAKLVPQSIIVFACGQLPTLGQSTLILEYLIKKYKNEVYPSLLNIKSIVMHGNYNLIEILLNNGIKETKEYITPTIVEIACYNGQYDLVVYLLSQIKNISNDLSLSRVLLMAAKSSNLKLLKYLYENINIDCGPLEVILSEFIKYNENDKLYYISYPDPTKTYFYNRLSKEPSNHNHDHDHDHDEEYQLKKYQEIIDYLKSIYTTESIQFFGDQMNQDGSTKYTLIQMHNMFGKSSHWWTSKLQYYFPEFE